MVEYRSRTVTEIPWQTRAACRGVDPELFYPENNAPGYAKTVKEAKSVCKACPVIEICGKDALQRREGYGIWGGMTPSERGTPGRKK